MTHNYDEVLDRYVRMSEPGYALLIQGKWGSGKTYAIKAWMKRYEEHRESLKAEGNTVPPAALYLSVYGVNSIELLDEKLLSAAAQAWIYDKVGQEPLVEFRAAKLVKRMGGGVMRLGSRFVENYVKLDKGDIKSFLVSLTSSEPRLLICDDLERSNLKLETLLGYLNGFVEHQGGHLILLADQVELEGKLKQTNKEPMAFEKLVGHTLNLKVDVEEVFERFLAQQDVSLQEIWRSHKMTVLRVHQESQTGNLRTLKRILRDAGPCLNTILACFDSHEELFSRETREHYFQRFIQKYAIIAHELARQGWEAHPTLTFQHLKKFEQQWTTWILQNLSMVSRARARHDYKTPDSKPSSLDGILNRYTISGEVSHPYVLPDGEWLRVFEQGTLDEESLLVHLIEAYADDARRYRNQHLRYLNAWQMSASTFLEAFVHTTTALLNNEIVILPIVLHYVSFLMYLKQEGITLPAHILLADVRFETISEIQTWAIARINYLDQNNKLEAGSKALQGINGWGGYGYVYTEEAFKKVYDHGEGLLKTRQDTARRHTFFEVFETQLGQEKWLFQVLFNQEGPYREDAVLCWLEERPELLTKLCEQEGVYLYLFAALIKERVSHQRSRRPEECSWIQRFYEEIQQSQRPEDIPFQLSLSTIRKDLEDALRTLECHELHQEDENVMVEELS